MLFELVKNLHRGFIISRTNLLTAVSTGKNNHIRLQFQAPFCLLSLITETSKEGGHGLNDSFENAALGSGF